MRLVTTLLFALLAVGASFSASAQDSAVGGEMVNKLATFGDAYTAPDGTSVDLQVMFSTDAVGKISSPKLQVLQGGKTTKISDYCIPKCIRRPDGSTFCVYRCKPGVLPGTGVPSTLLEGTENVVVEFSGNDFVESEPALTVKLLKNPNEIRNLSKLAGPGVTGGGFSE